MSSVALRLVVLGGLLFAATTPLEMEEYRERLASMSESEWTRIQANWELFQTLSPKERRELRAFHDELETLGPEAVELRAVLHQYAIWLDTLSPADRKAIAETGSTEERLQKVMSLIDSQNATLEKDLKPYLGPPGGDREQSQSRIRRDYVNQIYKSFDELNDALKPKLNALEEARLRELGSRPSLHRGALLLALKHKYAVDLKNQIPDRVEEYLNDRFSETVFQLLGLKTFAVANDDEKRQLRQFVFNILLFPKISPQEKVAFMERLSPEQREELRRIERIYGELNALLVRVLYYREHTDKLPEQLRETFNYPRTLRSGAPPQFPLDRRLDRSPRREGSRRSFEKSDPPR